MSDWLPVQYLKFKNERTQPSIDLINRINIADPSRIIDIGCGPGNSTGVLKNRWPNAEIYGLDNSESMLQKAKADFPDIQWLLKNAEEDLSSLGLFDIIFSNAVLQWIPSHETLLTALFEMLNPNGVIAAQVPYAKCLPIYTNIIELTRTEKWSGYFSCLPRFPKHYPYEHYYNIICELTDKIEIWQTDYIHVMHDYRSIVEWYKGTGLRPFLDMLPDENKRIDFCNDYRYLIAKNYSAEKSGNTLLPFTRIFFVAYR